MTFYRDVAIILAFLIAVVAAVWLFEVVSEAFKLRYV